MALLIQETAVQCFEPGPKFIEGLVVDHTGKSRVLNAQNTEYGSHAFINRNCESFNMKFARCRCFLESNVFLPAFGIHVTYQSESQFISTYESFLTEMGCRNIQPVIQQVSR